MVQAVIFGVNGISTATRGQLLAFGGKVVTARIIIIIARVSI